MSPMGLKKLTNAANRMEAWSDWKKVAIPAREAGHGDLVDKYTPADGASWRQIDRVTAALRAAIAATGQGEVGA